MDRPITTLFMLMSVDGKISTGSTDELDVDRDFPKLPGSGGLFRTLTSAYGVILNFNLKFTLNCGFAMLL